MLGWEVLFTKSFSISFFEANLGVGMTSSDIFVNSIKKIYFRVTAAATRGYHASNSNTFCNLKICDMVESNIFF